MTISLQNQYLWCRRFKTLLSFLTLCPQKWNLSVPSTFTLVSPLPGEDWTPPLRIQRIFPNSLGNHIGSTCSARYNERPSTPGEMTVQKNLLERSLSLEGKDATTSPETTPVSRNDLTALFRAQMKQLFNESVGAELSEKTKRIV